MSCEVMPPLAIIQAGSAASARTAETRQQKRCGRWRGCPHHHCPRRRHGSYRAGRPTVPALQRPDAPSRRPRRGNRPELRGRQVRCGLWHHVEARRAAGSCGRFRIRPRPGRARNAVRRARSPDLVAALWAPGRSAPGRTTVRCGIGTICPRARRAARLRRPPPGRSIPVALTTIHCPPAGPAKSSRIRDGPPSLMSARLMLATSSRLIAPRLLSATKSRRFDAV
jgi:hypothetical protein